VRVLSSSSCDDGEDDNDGDDSDSDDADDDNNGGNNGAYGGTYGVGGSQRVCRQIQMIITQDLNSSDDYSSGYDNYSRSYLSLESHMLGLTSGQQLERSTNTSTGFSTYCRNNYDDDFVSHRNSMWKCIH